MVITILWMIPNGYFLYLTFRKDQFKSLNEEKTNSMLSDELPNNFTNLDD
jgi:hypothetical protein